MIATSIVFIILGLLYTLFPNLAWKMGSYNISNDINISEENETIKALSKRRKLRFIRLVGVALMLVGLGLFIVYSFNNPRGVL
ncbi:MAG: hypothetical protein ACE3L7_26270 [Candidatus Pristimantibacillus sp.]